MGTDEAPQPPSGESKENEPPKQFTLEILKCVKDAQQQHGLRHGDYQRYRGYCSRRIRRLRKVLKLPQGDRRHFKRKDVTEGHIVNEQSDERFLHLPLMLAERNWAYAMQLRQEANTEPRKKFHLVQKLRKACVYALQLEELCKLDRCDARTKLESQAYTAWIHGTLHFELQLWEKATENLKKAQVIYEKLATAVSEQDQVSYKQRVEEIIPSLRYCAYNIGDEKAIDLLELRSQGVLENLETLISQSKEKTAKILHEIEWFGHKIPVRIERVRLFLLSINGLDDSLSNAEDVQAKIKLLENMFIDLRDIIALTREEAKSDNKSDQLLLAYLISVRVERTTQRNLLLIQQTRKPQDCVRLLDINVQQMTELKQSEALANDEEAQKVYEQKLSTFYALKAYYSGRSHVNSKRWRESYVLFKRCKEYCDKKFPDNCSPEILLLLNAMKDSVETDLLTSHANFILELEPEVVDVPQKVYKSKKPLIERLDEFREDRQLLTKNPNIVSLPPPMVPVPVKPLFYDLALNYVEMPSLAEKLDEGGKQKQSAGISGFVKGLWGWGKK